MEPYIALSGFEIERKPSDLKSVPELGLTVWEGHPRDALLCVWGLEHAQITDHWVVRLITSYVTGWRPVGLGDVIFVLDTVRVWYPAVVAATTSNAVYVHYFSWGKRYDEWILRDSFRLDLLPQHDQAQPLLGTRMSNHSCPHCVEMAERVPQLKWIRFCHNEFQTDQRWRYPSPIVQPPPQERPEGITYPRYVASALARACASSRASGSARALFLASDDLRRVYAYLAIVGIGETVAVRSDGTSSSYRPAKIVGTVIEPYGSLRVQVHVLGCAETKEVPSDRVSWLHACTDLVCTQRHASHDCDVCVALRASMSPNWGVRRLAESCAITLHGSADSFPVQQDTHQQDLCAELESMGFFDRAANLRALASSNGDLSGAVEVLLQG